MADPVSRRRFLKTSVAAGVSPALAMSLEEKALLAAAAEGTGAAPAPAATSGALPLGTLGKLRVSRILCGGNLISGFAHSRDLIYVSSLLRQYFTDEKVFETLALCEENGINAAIIRVDDHTVPLIRKYWDERGGKIQWIAQVKPTEKDLESDIARALDAGAKGVYVHGGVGDSFVQKGRVDLLGKSLEVARRRGAIVAGLGGHAIATIKAAEKEGFAPDFYMKTFNSKQYWSSTIPERNDSVWEETPEETREFMKTVACPWIAFKILGAGAIHPKQGFRYAFENGADFACVGMFDFQVVEDALIARDLFAKTLKRERPWRS